MSWSRRGAIGVAALTLASCGFRLRRSPPLAFGSIALAGFAPRSPLAAELQRELRSQVRVTDTPAAAEVVLHALADAREKSVVAQTAAAQVRELQLRVRLQYRVHTPAGRELLPPTLLLLARDLSYSETAALAKQHEEAELYREMQSDIVSQVMRRLATIKV
jgi:LPS-assembly lipoprotein